MASRQSENESGDKQKQNVRIKPLGLKDNKNLQPRTKKISGKRDGVLSTDVTIGNQV